MESEFPGRLRKLRERTRCKQYAVAHCCGVDRKTLSRYEKGEIEPSLTQLINMAIYFEVSIDYLAGLTEDPTIRR